MIPHSVTLKKKLKSLICKMCTQPEGFVTNAKTDFTRNRKLPLEDTIMLLVAMGGNSIKKELLSFFDHDARHIMTTSSFVQQRDKILPAALEWLFNRFTEESSKPKLYKGFRLLAVDGSDLHIPTNPKDKDTYFLATSKSKGYNLIHLNALYDLVNRLYVDAIIQPRRKANEHRALAQMVDRSTIASKVIVVADRGYESYNNLAHIAEKGWNYLIRVKDIGHSGLLSNLILPSTPTFDCPIKRILTRSQTKTVKAQPELYRWMPSNVIFDFLNSKSDEYAIDFRVVRIKLPSGGYETLITNLNPAAFPTAELAHLYNLRWGIETSFRELKYAVGLTNFHSKRAACITQEVFARLIMYNFSEMIISNIVIPNKATKYAYQVNFTAAIHICMHFLRCIANTRPPDVEVLIHKNVSPIRPGRSDPRKIRFKSSVSFIYRVA